MSHTVEKIGGTSIADTETVLRNVLLPASRKSPYGRIFVVSAYSGITNELLEHKKSGTPGVYGLFASSERRWSWNEALSSVGEAMRAKNADVFDNDSDRDIADTFVTERIEGVRSCLIDLNRLCSYGQFRLDEHLLTVREILAALGEAHSAHNTALLLRSKGVNATFVDLTGWRDDRKLTLQERLQEVFGKMDLEKELPIATGYANCSEGMVRLYDRGYTEVTFSRIAAITGAAEAIIHKEFHLSSADPNLVGAEKVKKIGYTNYDVADQLSNMGMEAIHPKAARGLRQAGISLRVKNTFDPEDPGTVIEDEVNTDVPSTEIVTGLKSVFALELFEQDMVGVKGYDSEILKTLERHKIRIVTKCSNANTITHYVDCSRKALKRAIGNLEEALENAEIEVRNVAIVSVIGANLKEKRLTADAVSALADNDIPVLGIHQLTRNVDLQIIVDEDRYDDTVAALHHALIERPPAERTSAKTTSAKAQTKAAA